MKIIFAGTSEFAQAALAAICAAGFDVALVLTQVDRPAGRGLKLQPSPVKQYAQQNGLAIYQTPSWRETGADAAQAQLAWEVVKKISPDVIVVTAYGLILPQKILALPRLGCVNIHASLLPRWRGAAPIQRAIIAGDTQTGISVMRMEAGLDTGPVFAQAPCAIFVEDTYDSLHLRLMSLGARMIVEHLQGCAANTLATPVVQAQQGITYAHKITKEESRLNPALDAEHLARCIRALNPHPGMYFQLRQQRIKVWQAHAVAREKSDFPHKTGKILAVDKHGVFLGCQTGILCITDLQKPGRPRMPLPSFLQSFPIHVGEDLDDIV